MASNLLYKQEKFIHQKLNRSKTNEYTKMVTAISKRRKSVKDENDPLRQRMLKERQDHARRQDEDYSHVFRKKTRFEMIRLSLIIMGIEFAYAAETAFVSPILLSIGIEHNKMTVVWALSPFLGFFLSPILGSISDRCSSRFGRRRPVIFMLSLGIIAGLVLAPYGRALGELVGVQDDNVTIVTSNGTFNEHLTNFQYETSPQYTGTTFYWALFFTVLGTLLLDFTADNCQTPSRAFLLDVCLPEEHGKALSTYTIMAGMGGCCGYALGAVDWNKTIFANLIGDNIKTVFALVTVIFIISMATTLTSFREVPLRLLESDEMLRPVTQVAVKKERERLKALEGAKMEVPVIVPATAIVVSEKARSTEMPANYSATSRASNASNSSSDDDEDEHDENHITFMMYLKSIIFMPKPLRILCITNCLAWMGHILYCLYFTDFVGESVFGGDPSADPESEEYQLYDQGIRFGAMGMSVYALSCALYSMIIERLIKRFTAKGVFVGGMALFSLAMALLAKFPTKIGVIAFSTTAGIVYATLFTIPFMLVAHYHGKGAFKIKQSPEAGENGGKNEAHEAVEFERGLGTDCGIVGSMLFVAQFTMSLSIGSFITLLDTTAAVLYAASFFSFLAAISGCFVLYMDL